jgi:hypothetical protein
VKKIKKSTSLRKYLFLGLGLAALVGVILFVKNKLIASPQIAQISGDQYCQSNVTKFAVSDECSYGTFKSYSFTCKNGTTIERLGSNACYEYFSAYQDAQKTCGVTCSTPQPTTSSTTRPSPTVYPSPSAPTRPSPIASSTAYPSPSLSSSPAATPSAPPACRAQELTHYAFRELCPVPAGATEQYRFIDYTCGDETTPRSMGSSESCQFYTSLKSGAEFYCRKNSCSIASSTPTPTPTPTPQPPVISCATEVYKLPAKFNATAVSSDILAKNKVSGRNIVARPGDRFAFNLNMTSKTKRVVSDARFDFSSWTTTSLGESAPFTIIQIGESCQSYPDKSVRCGIAKLNSPDRRQSLRPNTYMVVSIDEVSKPTLTDMTYHTLYAGENVDCSPVTINVLPKQQRRCYGYGRFQWCRYIDAR